MNPRRYLGGIVARWAMRHMSLPFREITDAIPVRFGPGELLPAQPLRPQPSCSHDGRLDAYPIRREGLCVSQGDEAERHHMSVVECGRCDAGNALNEVAGKGAASTSSFFDHGCKLVAVGRLAAGATILRELVLDERGRRLVGEKREKRQ